MDRIFLTGASGYVGTCIARELTCRGQTATVLTGRLSEIPRRSIDADVVIHCAGALRHRPAEHESANLLGTQSLLRGLARADTRVIFISSRGVYAPSGELQIDESAPVGADDSYGRTKLLAEQAILESCRTAIILRPTTLIGRGVHDSGRSFVASALARMLAGEVVVLHEPDRDVDFLDVNDFAQIVHHLIRIPEAWGQAWNAAAPPRSLHGLLQRLADTVESATGMTVQIQKVPGPPSRAPLLNAERLTKLIPGIVLRGDGQTCREMLACAGNGAKGQN